MPISPITFEMSPERSTTKSGNGIVATSGNDRIDEREVGPRTLH
jgi:hypothetical protein